MTDLPIAERLRAGFDDWTPDPTYELRHEAASTIETLYDALDNLADIADIAMRREGGEGYWAVEDARKALKRTEGHAAHG